MFGLSNPRSNLVQSVRVYVTSLSMLNKHTWLSHDHVPNKYIKLYRDIHGPVLYHGEAAREFIFALSHEERASLLGELNSFVSAQQTEPMEPPTSNQLRLVTLHQTLPFIGFGFLDNFLMIVAGEYIDMTLGAALGITTMAAAGLGNMISDVAGVGSAHYVEVFVSKFGVRTPRLTPQQVDMKSTRWASSFGKVIGVTIGCLLGMCPLFFFDKKRDDDAGDKKGVKESKSSS